MAWGITTSIHGLVPVPEKRKDHNREAQQQLNALYGKTDSPSEAEAMKIGVDIVMVNLKEKIMREVTDYGESLSISLEHYICPQLARLFIYKKLQEELDNLIYLCAVQAAATGDSRDSIAAALNMDGHSDLTKKFKKLTEDAKRYQDAEETDTPLTLTYLGHHFDIDPKSPMQDVDHHLEDINPIVGMKRNRILEAQMEAHRRIMDDNNGTKKQ